MPRKQISLSEQDFCLQATLTLGGQASFTACSERQWALLLPITFSLGWGEGSTTLLCFPLLAGDPKRRGQRKELGKPWKGQFGSKQLAINIPVLATMLTFLNQKFNHIPIGATQNLAAWLELCPGAWASQPWGDDQAQSPESPGSEGHKIATAINIC